MTTTQPGHDKTHEHRRRFDTLPNILVQDPARECAYYIPANELTNFEATAETWSQLDDSTVTLVIPDGELIDEVPPSLRTPELLPSVLIRYNRGKKAFFLTHEQLRQFKIEQPTEPFDPDSISFIVPRGTELIEELPLLRRALLQSGTQ
ncbi:MAG: hypothetical protein ACRDN9_08690 [Streptosporangiaceae bacterium]